MTAQIQDRVFFNRGEYILCGTKGEGLTTPAQFGMQTAMISTACYRGYHLTYRVIDDTLSLTEMVVRTPDDVYPTLNGVEAVFDKEWHVARYTGLQIKTAFTGCLLIANNFIGPLYAHTGFQKPTSYRNVIELRFQHGEMQQAVDCSEQIGQMRVNMLSRRTAKREDEIAGWMTQMFSLDYEV
jgi:hypothetical protein